MGMLCLCLPFSFPPPYVLSPWHLKCSGLGWFSDDSHLALSDSSNWQCALLCAMCQKSSCSWFVWRSPCLLRLWRALLLPLLPAAAVWWHRCVAGWRCLVRSSARTIGPARAAVSFSHPSLPLLFFKRGVVGVSLLAISALKGFRSAYSSTALAPIAQL